MAGAQGQPTDPSAATVWIDAYLAAQPDEKRAALQALRETIAAAAPQAVEAVSYWLPAFRYRGKPLVWYHAAKAHCSFFPTGAPIETLRAELSDFVVAKGTIQFTPEHPLPTNLVTRIVRLRIDQMDAEADGRTEKQVARRPPPNP
jgi:uncharacterized protein YdhG (YjbR/CyaY superfamily)